MRQLQQELADSLKKLSMSEASLEASMRKCNDLEAEKSRLIHDVERLKNKLQESEDRCNQAERRNSALKSSLDDKDGETCAITQRLQEAVKTLEMENGKLEATAKQQRNKIEAMQKEALEAVRQPERLPGGAGELKEEKGELASEMETEVKMVMKIVEQEKDGMLEPNQVEQDHREGEDRAWLKIRQTLEEADLFLQKRTALQGPLDQRNMSKDSDRCSSQEQRIRSLVGFWRLWGKLI